jgi:hypothetical protein
MRSCACARVCITSCARVGAAARPTPVKFSFARPSQISDLLYLRASRVFYITFSTRVLYTYVRQTYYHICICNMYNMYVYDLKQRFPTGENSPPPGGIYCGDGITKIIMIFYNVFIFNRFFLYLILLLRKLIYITFLK